MLDIIFKRGLLRQRASYPSALTVKWPFNTLRHPFGHGSEKLRLDKWQRAIATGRSVSHYRQLLGPAGLFKKYEKLSLKSDAREELEIPLRFEGRIIVRPSFHLSPHSHSTPLKLEAWNLAFIILTWMSPKLPTGFLVFCLEVEIFKFKVMKWIKGGNRSLGRIWHFSPHKKCPPT